MAFGARALEDRAPWRHFRLGKVGVCRLGKLLGFSFPPKPTGDPQPIKITADVIEAIARTPLIELRAASKVRGCKILGKAEFMNPGGSV